MSNNEGLTEAIALDCEMVGAGPRGNINLPARVSIVNEHYCCIYDAYVLPTKEVTDYRTAISGIKPHHLKTAQPLHEVKKVVASYLRGRILVGHSVDQDLKVLGLCHPKHKMRDIAYYPPLRTNCGSPSLKDLAAKYARMNIQNGCRSSVRDARAAMMVYKQLEDEWEDWLDEYNVVDPNGYYYDYECYEYECYDYEYDVYDYEYDDYDNECDFIDYNSW